MSAIIRNQENLKSAKALLVKQEAEIENAYHYYLTIIINAIDKCGGLIHEGNYNLFTRTDDKTGE